MNWRYFLTAPGGAAARSTVAPLIRSAWIEFGKQKRPRARNRDVNYHAVICRNVEDHANAAKRKKFVGAAKPSANGWQKKFGDAEGNQASLITRGRRQLFCTPLKNSDYPQRYKRYARMEFSI